VTPERLTAALAERYRIERELGAGGMATVYLAHDLKHERDVAIKVLHPDLGAALGADRFLAEIRTTARLQHPHILPLLDSGEADGLLYYVMPLVTGETLRTRLERERQLPIAEAVRIAREVASALDYAHRQGVIHRDIKPENILLHDGQALVADFGIALAVQQAGGARMTQTGLSLGTPQYMSPEQAMGEKQIDARSDVYALAAVTYEMLAGDAPFTGGSVQAIVAKIMAEKPTPVHTVRDTVPEHVEDAVLTALAKLPADRFATAAEFAAALTNPTVAGRATRVAAAPGPLGLSRQATGLLLAGLAAVAVGALAFAALGRPTADAPARVVRYELSTRTGQQLVSPGGTRFAWSPDGEEYIYTGVGGASTMLWSRRLDALEAVPIRGSENATSPTYSPDGREIAFVTVAPFSLVVVPSAGGPARTVVDASGGAAGGGVAWSDDGFLYYDGGTGLARVRPDGSEQEMMMTLDTTVREIGMAWPQTLPGGRGVVFRVRRAQTAMSDWSIVAFDSRDRSRKELVRGLFARYSPATQHLLWVTADGALMAQPIDLDRLVLRGEAMRLMEGIAIGGFGAVDVALSSAGDFVYVPGGTGAAIGQLSWVDRRGNITVAERTAFDGLVRDLVLSPNGAAAAVAMERPSDLSNFARIWVTAMGGGPLQLVTSENRGARAPLWSADGRSLVYLSDEGTTIYRRRADGSGAAELLATVPRGITSLTLHPSGLSIVFRGQDSGDRRPELLDLRLDGDGTPRPLIDGEVLNSEPSFSPDGRWLAYVSSSTGRDEVYVRPYPDVDASLVQVSGDGGGAPRWNRAGGELFYVNDAGAVVSVRYTATDGFRVTGTEQLFTPQGVRGGGNRIMYDPAPDGQRFLMLDIGEGAAGGESRPVMVQNFIAELRSKVPQ
jgi:eukaryotic-like serine/threonine-protein kinase